MIRAYHLCKHWDWEVMRGTYNVRFYTLVPFVLKEPNKGHTLFWEEIPDPDPIPPVSITFSETDRYNELKWGRELTTWDHFHHTVTTVDLYLLSLFGMKGDKIDSAADLLTPETKLRLVEDLGKEVQDKIPGAQLILPDKDRINIPMRRTENKKNRISFGKWYAVSMFPELKKVPKPLVTDYVRDKL